MSGGGAAALDALEGLPAPVVLLDRSERVTYLNPAAESLLGAGRGGRHFSTIVRQPAVLEAVEAGYRGERRTARFSRPGGGVHVVTVSPRPGGLTLFFEDRTDSDAALRMRRDFVANVSHELRTPLTALAGFIETLRGPAKDDPEARERFLDTMGREAARMNRLVSDLLSLSRVEEERRRPRGGVRLLDIARRAAATLAPLARERGVEIRNAVDPGASVVGDADQLLQVAQNLVENGIKYGGARVSLDTARVEYEPSLRAPGWRLSVSDDGAGIDERHLPRLTERFYRVDGDRSRGLGGTGLGLAIVKHIVARHGGGLRIASGPGGSVFSVVLPIWEGTAAGPPDGAGSGGR